MSLSCVYIFARLHCPLVSAASLFKSLRPLLRWIGSCSALVSLAISRTTPSIENMHQRQLLPALLLVPQHMSADSYPICSTSTSASSEWRYQQLQTSTPHTISPVLRSVNMPPPSSFGSATIMSTHSSTLAQTISAPTEANLGTTWPSKIDALFIHDSNVDQDKEHVLGEDIQSTLFRKALEWAPTLVAFLLILAKGWYKPPQEPAAFWTVANLVVPGR